MIKTLCLGGRHFSNTNNITQNEKVNPRTKKLVKFIKGKCTICDCNKSQIFNTLSKLQQMKILSRKEDVKINTVQLCQIQHGMI